MNAHTSTAKGLFLAAALSVGAVAAVDLQAQDVNPAPPSGPSSENGMLKFQNQPVTSVLDLYERLTGKHLILDTNLGGVMVTLNATGLNKIDQINYIKAALLLNGVAIVPVDDKSEKIITVGTNKLPRSEGIALYSRAADLPNDEEVVSYYMPLNYINPQEAVGVFTQTAPVHTYGAYVPAPSAQAVIVTENTSVIRSLIALKDLIDVAPARVVTEWIQLNRADSDKVADILNKMLGVGPNGAPIAPPGPGGAVIVPPGLGNGSPLANEHNLISGNALVISDPNSNRILLSTRPVNLPFLEQMVAQLDQPDIFAVPQRRALKYVLANDILPALEAALAQGKDQEDQLKKDQQTAQQASQQNQNGGARTGGNGQTTGATGGASSGGSGTGVQAITPQLAAPTENNVPTVITLGKTRLLADNRSNSIIVFGSPDVVTRAFAMIDQLDRRPLQVYLATVIGQLAVTQDLEFGIDILQKFQHVGQGGLSTSNLNSAQVPASGAAGSGFFPEPSALTSAAGFPLPTGLTLYGAIGSTLNAYVRALESTDRFKIISHPSVYTTNNTLAVIATGSQVPVPQSTVSGFTTGTDLTTQSSIAYESVELQLSIVPLINANHDVTLKIRQTNNSLGNNVTISGNPVPIINTQEINTEVTVPDKSTIVIGGLITDKTTRDQSGLPFLSDIPILGYLFSDTTKDKERDELIIMIQPTVVETDADQIAVNEEEKQRTILGREAVEAATGLPADKQGAVVPVHPFGTTSTTTTTTSAHGAGTIYNSKFGRNNPTTTTTTTTVRRVSTQELTPVGPTTPTGPVPALSTPAPDVQQGRMPPVNPPTGSTPPPTAQP